jgi:hypothetical protein
VAFCLQRVNDYGLSPDNRADNTNLDGHLFMDPIGERVNEGPSRRASH